ncbi:MAG TPA: alpha/beta hydrolase, partial [Thermoanaerobaculia bacterium]|nr:alpha/beta hydrolase [Thermoanaerobaculia bacterium]
PEGEPLTMDVYRPPTVPARLPLVLMVHGGPVPKLGAKNMGVFTSYGRLLAASGFAAAAFDHRFLAAARLEDAAGDVASAIAHVREHADELGIDDDRLALWVFSGGGPFLSLALRGAPRYVRAALAFYAALDIREKAPGSTAEIGDDVRRAFSPAHHVRAEGGRTAPLFVARAGLDHPFLNASIDRFVADALAANAEIDVMNHATGRHGFDFLDDDARSREIIARAIEFLKGRLLPSAPGS